ncbi:MAG: ATP-binding protein [Actinomycetales bacterium]
MHDDAALPRPRPEPADDDAGAAHGSSAEAAADAQSSAVPVGGQVPLFDIPETARAPLAKVVLVTGPSGSGKTRLTRRLGLPVVPLDDFYLDGDHPGLPRRHGMVDWDDPASWDGAAAVAALVELVTTGRVELPVYDIPTNSRVSTRVVELGEARAVVAEGIFAAEIIDACRAEGILADALTLTRPRLQTFVFRLARDLDEGRKPPVNLLRRGVSLALAEPAMYRHLVGKGARKARIDEAERTILRIAAGLPPQPLED